MSEASMLDMNFDEVYDMEVIPEGEECQVSIIAADVTGKKNAEDEKMLVVRFSVIDHDTAEDIYHYLSIPNAELKRTDAKKANKQMLRIREFYQAFDVDYSQPVELANLQGLIGWAIVGVQKPTAEYPQEKNFIKSFVLRG